MRLLPRFSAALLIAAVALCCPAAAEKVTVDPNAPGIERESPQPNVMDERLARKVDYEATRKSVESILDELTQKTGVALRAGYNKYDWQVRDRKMCIFSKDVALSDLMISIARVMKFKWSKEKVRGNYVYRLYMDRRTLLDEDAQRAREEERLARLQADKRRKSLQSFVDLASLSEEDAANLRNVNPYKYFLATSGVAKSVSAFFGIAPSVVEALASGERLALPAGSLSPEGRRQAHQTMRDLSDIESFPDMGEQPVSDDSDDLVISVNGDLDGIRRYMQGTTAILGDVEIASGDTSVSIDLIDPDSDLARTVGEVVLDCQQDGRSPSEAEEVARDRISRALVSDANKDTPDDPQPERPDGPDMHKKIKIESKSNELPDVQHAVAEASGFAVVSDCFTRTAGLPLPQGRDTELGDLLDKISDSFNYDWDKHGSVIEFRDKRWFQKRAAQIPEAWIEKWRKKFKEADMLDLDDLVQIMALTEEQFRENIAEDEVLGKSGAPGIFWTMRDFLKLYGSLSQAERFAVFTEDGLELGILNADQSALLREVISTRNPLFLQRDPASLALSAARVKFSGKMRYVFTILSNEDQDQIVMRMDVPKYEELQDAIDDLR